MAHEKGNGLRFYWNVGTYGAPSYVTALEGEQSTDLNVSMSPIITTDKDDNDWENSLNGVRTWSMNFAARGDTGSSAQDKFITILTDNPQLLSKVEWKTFDGNKYYGDVWGTNLTIAGAYDGAIEVTGTATGSGALTQAAA